ncbi:MAG: hypothetical protein SVK08_00475 [Halobacteriota archaeon]|nr:hypothetical protein [Halobacteriota archaeon]
MSMLKIAVSADFLDTMIAKHRASRRSDEGLGKFIVSKELLGDRNKKGVAGFLIGGAGGASLGTLIAALAKKRPALGAVAGGVTGAMIGDSIGQFKADKEYFARKGIKLRGLGFTSDMTPEARRKYLKSRSAKS